jgi:phosphate transport system substrate-binding protein
MPRKMIKTAVALLMSVPVLGATAQIEIDSNLPVYRATSAVSGSIKSIGSDTMNNLMTLWGEEFKVFYPSAQIEIEGKGSSTAPTALIEGQAQFGPMSRPMKSSEIDQFEAKFGYPPVALRAGIDALAVFVHRDCPLDEISIDQLTAVFSVSGKDMTWGDLGVTNADWKARPVSLYGRNSASGTYGFFKSVALQGNDFKASVKEQPGSSAVVQGVATDRYSMGYSGVGYATADVKMLKVSLDGGDALPPTAEFANTGEYPLARFLYVYINSDPIKGLDPLRAEFVKLMFSQQGQEVVLKDGYFPVSAEVAREDLKACGIVPDF